MSVISNLSSEIFRLLSIKDQIGVRLKEARTRKSLKQADLSTMGEINRATQISYETGLTEPTTAYLRRIQPSGIDLPFVLFGSSADAIVQDIGSSHGVDWKLLQQCFEDVDFFCLRFAPACPSSYRWQMIQSLYTKIQTAAKAGEGWSTDQRMGSMEMVESIWAEYGK